jgi:hypothetical protein
VQSKEVSVSEIVMATLRDLGIYDAPPNWAGAWDSIRIRTQTANALTIIRKELRRWVDATTL